MYKFYRAGVSPEAASRFLRGRGKTVYILPSLDPNLTLLFVGFTEYDDDDDISFIYNQNLALSPTLINALAIEIVRSRRTVNRLYENKAQLNSISMHLGESIAVARTVGHLSKSAEVMKTVNDLMKAPEMAVKMQEFSKEMIKAGVIEEMVNDAVDSALDSDDIEDEIEEEVDKVLTAIAGETVAQLPEASRKERLKQPAHAEEEGGDDEDLEELRVRLAKVRS
ncbi:putative Snf7 family protein [Helianthus anomalus]